MPYFMGEQNVARDGLFYEVSGSGEPIILVNGLSRSSRHWVDFPNALSKFMTVATIDNRGCGRSRSVVPKWTLSVKDMAADVWDLAEILGWKSFHILGLSLGGMVAMEMARQNNGKLLSATIINSSIGGQPGQRLSWRAIRNLLWGAFQKKDMLDLMSRSLIDGIDEQRRSYIVEEWKTYERLEPISQVVVQKQLFAASQYRPGKSLGSIKVPTMILATKDDAFVPIESSYSLHRLMPHATFKVLPKGGHEITASRPGDVVAELQAFLQAIKAK